MAEYSMFDSPVKIYGLAVAEPGKIRRLPDDVFDKVNDGVTGLSWHTAGGRLRFRTDADKIGIKYTLRDNPNMSHMAFSGSSGVDCYFEEGSGAYGSFGTMFSGCTHPEIGKKEVAGEFLRRNYPNNSGVVDVTLNLPLYNGIESLTLILPDGAVIEPPTPYEIEKPIVFYGSSITQGGCASKPSNAYTSIIAEKLRADHINLGFSGSARGEETICRYIAGLCMSCFVMDYDHNAPDVDHLRRTHLPFYKIIREAQPELPIIFVGRPDYETWLDASEKRAEVILDTFSYAVKNGDRNVIYVPGRDLFEREMRGHCTVDGCHPTDLGFWRMAQVIGEAVARAIVGNDIREI